MKSMLVLLLTYTMSSCLISLEPKYPACYGVEFNPCTNSLTRIVNIQANRFIHCYTVIL